MAYIGRASVPAEWTSLETLLSTTFTSGKNYSMQVLQGSNVRFCNSTALPTDNFAGENLKDLMSAVYSPDTGTLYVRNASSAPSFVVVSELA